MRTAIGEIHGSVSHFANCPCTLASNAISPHYFYDQNFSHALNLQFKSVCKKDDVVMLHTWKYTMHFSKLDPPNAEGRVYVKKVQFWFILARWPSPMPTLDHLHVVRGDFSFSKGDNLQNCQCSCNLEYYLVWPKVFRSISATKLIGGLKLPSRLFRIVGHFCKSSLSPFKASVNIAILCPSYGATAEEKRAPFARVKSR